MSLDFHLEDDRPVTTDGGVTIFHRNITHNLIPMAHEAGLHQYLWRATDAGYTHAKELADGLQAGLIALLSDPNRFRALNPSNGWGSYDVFVTDVVRILIACRDYPDAYIYISR